MTGTNTVRKVQFSERELKEGALFALVRDATASVVCDVMDQMPELACREGRISDAARRLYEAGPRDAAAYGELDEALRDWRRGVSYALTQAVLHGLAPFLAEDEALAEQANLLAAPPR